MVAVLVGEEDAVQFVHSSPEHLLPEIRAGIHYQY